MPDEEEGALMYEADEDAQIVYEPAGQELNDKHEADSSNWEDRRSRGRTYGLSHFASAVMGCILTAAVFGGHRFYTSQNTSHTDAQMATTSSNSPIWTASGVTAQPDWSRFAYSSYSTDHERLCHSVMMVEKLVEVGARGQRVIMYPQEFHPPEPMNATSRLTDQTARGLTEQQKLLIKARDEYGATLIPVEVLQGSPDQESTWMDSFTKLLVFNLTQYDRVVHMDSDSVVLKSMDELFFLPPATVAMPRAYWLLPKLVLSNQIMVVTPSTAEFERNLNKIERHDSSVYDMDIVNELYMEDSEIIPHRPYNLVTGDFRFKGEEHNKYLGTAALPRKEEVINPFAPTKEPEAKPSDNVLTTKPKSRSKLTRRLKALFARASSDSKLHWDAQAVFDEAKFVHFSDWPYPKPWLNAPYHQTQSLRPACEGGLVHSTCPARKIWLHLYEDFRARRSRICGLD